MARSTFFENEHVKNLLVDNCDKIEILTIYFNIKIYHNNLKNYKFLL